MSIPVFRACWLLGALAQVAHAQSIAGMATESITGTPLAGVVVSALDSASRPLARVITDRRGMYRIGIPAAAMRLEFRRIGYLRVEIAIASRNEDRVDAVLRPVPAELPPVRAVAQAQCDRGVDRSRALAYWEEARSGLLASAIAREARAGRISVLLHTGWVDDTIALPWTVSRVNMEAASRMFYVSADPAVLEKEGFFTASRGGGSFIGPDESALFDLGFLTTHCFELAAETDTSVQLRFVPAPSRTNVVDISGVVSLRKSPVELKSVDYRYERLDARLSRAHAGGTLAFERLPTGLSMVVAWRLRSAVLYRSKVSITDIGATIESIEWPDGSRYEAMLGTLSGIVTAGGRPIPDAQVGLLGTPFSAVSDASGNYTMTGILPGPYTAIAADPALDLHGINTGPRQDVLIKAGPNAMTLAGMAPATLVARACRDYGEGIYSVQRGATKALFVRVVSDDSRRVARVPFHLEFRADGAGAVGATLDGKADADGFVRICGLYDGIVTLRIGAGDRRVISEIQLPPRATYAVATVELGPRPPREQPD